MAEYIKKAELEKFKYLSVVTYEGGKKENKAVIAIGCEIFNEMPTIDIVTCKECKHSNVDKMGWYCKKHYHRFIDEDKHFCSYGERSDDNDT